jgi:nucleotide sugar dehydrogenase
MSKNQVCVIGLGQIGLPVAQYIFDKGFTVTGYDINPETVKNSAKMGKFKVTDQWEKVPKASIFVICVTTGQKNDQPDLSAVFEVCKKVAQKADPKTLVTIESTILPGTCKKIFEEIFKGQVKLVHAPHRYWADQPAEHGVNQLRVIGGVDKKSLTDGLKFYKTELGIPMHPVIKVEVAEMCKIAENSHRFLQIAFAEEVRMMSDELGLDFSELRDAMNTKWNVDMPEARDGIGRHCLPKDIHYVTTVAPKNNLILNSAMQVDKKYREWLTKNKK